MAYQRAQRVIRTYVNEEENYSFMHKNEISEKIIGVAIEVLKVDGMARKKQIKNENEKVSPIASYCEIIHNVSTFE